jgi:hypothetical protein
LPDIGQQRIDRLVAFDDFARGRTALGGADPKLFLSPAPQTEEIMVHRRRRPHGALLTRPTPPAIRSASIVRHQVKQRNAGIMT